MPAQRGRDFKVAIDTTGSGGYQDIGSARADALTINNNPVDVTDKDSAGIQEMLGDAGVQQLTMAGDGVFNNATQEQFLFTAAQNRTTHSWRLTFPNGDTITASFVIEDYNRGGPHDDAETFNYTIRRSGASVYTPA